MQIQLKQSDVEQAIKNYVAAVGITREVSDINFTMGRKSSGLVADIEVSDTDIRVSTKGCHVPPMGQPIPNDKVKVEVVGVTGETDAPDDHAETVTESVEDTPPFDTDSDNEEETSEAEAPSGKASLFGS